MVSANYDLNLTIPWQFHLGELPRKQNIPVATTHTCCKAGGALNELEMFSEEIQWRSVILPHDWLTEQDLDHSADAAGGFKHRRTAWYYVRFPLDDAPIARARLVFDGVLGNATIYVNGVVAGRNFSGYNRFSCDVSAYLLSGSENTIAVYVDARRFEGWWYEGAGIYRPVRLEFREDICFDRENCFVISQLTETGWHVAADLSVLGSGKVEAHLLDAEGNTISTAQGTHLQLPVENPVLWSPDKPYLYQLLCKLTVDGRQVDTFCAKVGLRQIEWVADKGMFLNGQHCPIKGICCHQDHSGVGAAIPDELMEHRIISLKHLGINAYRCAHHAPAESLLDICDRLGMLVMVENRHFALSQDVLAQVDALVKLSRNHPSVFLYSLFNEEPWQQEHRGRRIAEGLRNRILALDNTRAITGAQNGGMLEKSNAADVLDVVGVNYFLKDYEATHARLPQKVILGTENCPTYATRGEYVSDPQRQIFGCYGDEWGAFSESLEETMECIAGKPYVAGCFAWCGFDHRGEPTPYGWPSVLSHWGFQDECGFPKDTAFLLRAWYEEKLCVHLLPHWNWKQGQNIRVCAYTNADTAELFLNGTSLGETAVERKRAQWHVPYVSGELKVIAKRNGEEAWDSVVTAGNAYHLTAEDVSTGKVRIINVAVTDEAGVLVPDFNKEITFRVSDGQILGIGNGDPNSHHHQKASSIRLFHGKAQVIASPGAQVTFQCQGLPEVTL